MGSTHRKLSEITSYIDANYNSDPNLSPEDTYQSIEQLAIASLDSQFDNYDEGILESYLRFYLKMKRMELGL